MQDLDENWTAKDIAAYTKFCHRQVSERWAYLPDFPKAYRPGGKGERRWKKSEIIMWWEAQKQAA